MIVCLAAAGFWAFGKVKEIFSPKDGGMMFSSYRPDKVKADAEKAEKSGSRLPTLGAPSATREAPLVPQASRVVILKHREVPPADWVAQAQALGASCLVDPVNRSVLLKGPVDAINIVAEALEAADVVPGSCGLQTFAVYVSREAIKGFDLKAALLAVTGDGVTGTIGDGAISFDLGLDRITAALDLIADGQTVEVVQRPHVRLLDRVPANVEATDEVPIPSTSVSQGIAQTSITYRKVGLQLTVNPVFLSGDRLRLNVVQSNGVIGSTVEIDGNEVPIIQAQTVSSALELSVGQSVLLGGVRTFRRENKRGLLGKSESVQEGALYVVLCTYSDSPRATEIRPEVEFPQNVWIPSPGLPPAEDPRDWIDGHLLPPKGWQDEEESFIRSKAAK